MRRALLALGVLLVAPAAWAGAWTRDAGSYYFKVGFDVYGAGNFAAAGRIAAVGQSYFARQLNLYGEVGVLPQWPVQVSVSLPAMTSGTLYQGKIHIPASGPRATVVRPGDLQVQVQAALSKKAPIALAVQAKVPLYQNGKIGLDYGTSYKDLFPLPGDGQVDLTGWFLAGASLKGAPLWNDFGVGYRHRTEWFIGWDTNATVVDGIPFYDTFGASLGKWTPMLRVDGIVNLKKDVYTRENVALGPAVMFDVHDGVALEARLSGDLWAHDASRGLGGEIGISVRR